MESIDVSFGTFAIGLLNGDWSVGDVIYGKPYLEDLFAISNVQQSPVKVRILWTYAHVSGDLRPYLHLIKQFNEGVNNGLPVVSIINNIVKEHFINNGDRPSLYNTSLSDDFLLTLFLQSVYVSMRARFTTINTSTTHLKH